MNRETITRLATLFRPQEQSLGCWVIFIQGAESQVNQFHTESACGWGRLDPNGAREVREEN